MDLVTLTLREYAAGFKSDNNSGTGNISGSSQRATMRRCRTREQGIALMTVGHAIEYLVDSRLVKQQNTSNSEREALAILMQANLSVYNEGAEIVPIASRLRQWFRGGSIGIKAEPANVTG
jgi:hypothetical protein